MEEHKYTKENIKIVNEIFTFAENYIKSKCKHLSEEKVKLLREWIYRNRNRLIDWKIDMPLKSAQELYEPILNEVRIKLEDDKRLVI